MLTVNTPYSRDLAGYLKTQQVRTCDLREGDVIVDDHSVWHAVVKKNDDGSYSVLDADENGCDGELAEATHTIIARECLRERAR